jgi:hypothetical protein
LDKHHQKITAETLKEMSAENLLKFDRLMIQSLDHLDRIQVSSYVGFNFGVNAMSILNNTIENWMIIFCKIENWMIIILLCTFVFVFKAKLDPILAALIVIVVLYFMKSGYDNVEISNLKNDMRRLNENNGVAILNLKSMISNLYPNPNSYCFNDVDVMTEISKLKDDIATRHTAEREEIKTLEQLFEQYKADETLFKSSTFALINPRPIFPILSPEAFTASSSYPKRNEAPSCWVTEHNGPNSFIQVNLEQLYLINEIQTRGRGGSIYNQYMKSYKVGYVHHELNIEVTLHNLQDGNIFDGNYGDIEIASNKYFLPFIAQYIKLYPIEFNNHISLNWEVIAISLSKIDEKRLKLFLLTSSEKSISTPAVNGNTRLLGMN